jgi:hypothetical protein
MVVERRRWRRGVSGVVKWHRVGWRRAAALGTVGVVGCAATAVSASVERAAGVGGKKAWRGSGREERIFFLAADYGDVGAARNSR